MSLMRSRFIFPSYWIRGVFSRCVFDSKRKKKKRTEQKAFLLDRNYPSHDNIDILLSFFTLLARYTYLYYGCVSI